MKKIALATLFISGLLFAQNSAISSHTFFTYSGMGNVQISEVRVPTDGLIRRTYYESHGFWSQRWNYGQGYAGIQEYDSRGTKVHIFSVWDDDGGNLPEYLAYGMTAERFGNEGHGLKTWHKASDASDVLYWQPDVWYTHVVKCWPIGDRTHYGFFVRDGESGVWRHLSTISVTGGNLLLTGLNVYGSGDYNNDAFIEDWNSDMVSTGANKREIHLRNQWRLLAENGEWEFAKNANYSINTGDLNGRSSNYKTNWVG